MLILVVAFVAGFLGIAVLGHVLVLAALLPEARDEGRALVAGLKARLVGPRASAEQQRDLTRSLIAGVMQRR